MDHAPALARGSQVVVSTSDRSQSCSRRAAVWFRGPRLLHHTQRAFGRLLRPGIAVVLLATPLAMIELFDVPSASAVTIPAPNSTDWTAAGPNVTFSDGDVQLTTASEGEHDAVWYDDPLTVTSLTVSFEIAMSGGTGADGETVALVPYLSPSDPVLSSEVSTATGGGSIGFEGLTGVAVSFDTYQDSCGDPSSNFVAIVWGTSSSCDGEGDLKYSGFPDSTSIPTLSGHTTPATVMFTEGSSPSVEVFLGGSLVLSSAIPASDFPSEAYLGFTAATGDDDQNQGIDDFTVGTAGYTMAPLATAMAGHDASKNSSSTSCGKYPVDCASGDFWHTFTDYSIPTYGPPLELTRTYNSLEAGTDGPFGYGWSSSYGTNLVVDSDDACSALGDADGCVTITEDDGSQVTADPNGDGGFTVPSWADSTLTQSDGSYSFVRQGTETFVYNSSGQLTSISDPSGDTETLFYDSPSPGSGHCPGTAASCETITSASGRALTLGWSGSGDTGTVTSATDPMGRQTTYAYDDSGDLTSVTDPLGHVTSFTYGTGSAAHLLLTMTFPNGQSGGPDAGDDVTNTYDSYGRVLTQTDPDGNETTFSYSGGPSANFSDAGGSTTITDPPLSG